MGIKKLQKKYMFLLLVLSGILIAYISINFSNSWIFVKINDKTYVANSLKLYESIQEKQIGATQYKQISFLKPTRNSGSNILPYGCFIYEGENENEIYIELKDQYIKLVSIDTDNWESGDKVTLEDLQ